MFEPRVFKVREGEYELTFTCMLCKKDRKVTVSAENYNKWLRGFKVQEAFPDMDKGDRELFISSICSPCFDGIFAE